jgi:hypothetical protein
MLSDDGSTPVVVPIGTVTGQVPTVDPTAAVGWSWKNLPDGSTTAKGILQLGTTAGTACAGNDVRLVGARPYAGRVVNTSRNSTTSCWSQDGRFNWLAGGVLPSGGWYGICWDPTHSRFVTISNGATSPGASYYSVDGGVSWTLGGVLSASITSWFYVYYDPGHDRLVAVPFQQTSGAVYSSNGGSTWTASVSVIPSKAYLLSCYDPDHNRIIYTSNLDVTTLYTADGGVTWIVGGAPQNAVGGIAHDPVHSKVVALPIQGTQSLYSSDGGTTWSLGGTVPSGEYYGLVWDPIHSRLIGASSSGTQTVYSTDGGLTWVNGGVLPLAASTRSIVYDPATGRVLVPSNTGTSVVCITEDGGTSWFSIATPTTGPVLAVSYP